MIYAAYQRLDREFFVETGMKDGRSRYDMEEMYEGRDPNALTDTQRQLMNDHITSRSRRRMN